MQFPISITLKHPFKKAQLANINSVHITKLPPTCRSESLRRDAC